MNAVYEGKNVHAWVSLLSSGDVVERCAAALALAELEPQAAPGKDSLLAALNDTDIPVQVAARIALGVMYITAENRRKMFAGLITGDAYTRHEIIHSLRWLASPDALLTSAPPVVEAAIPPVELAPSELPDSPAVHQALSASTSASVEQPDIALVHVLPWWFLLGGVALCLTLAWLLRGVWWSKWTLASTAAVAALWLAYLWSRRQAGTLSLNRFRARARLAGSAIFACTCGFAIGLLLPIGTVYVDNESGVNVRLLLDDKDWLTIVSGESKRIALAQGKYRLAVMSAEGNRVLDAYDVEITGYGKYVLNVLSGQVYFQGKLQYGDARSVDVKVLSAKWIVVPDVDYLFRDPPQSIVAQNSVTKTFFTRGVPPRLRRVE